jgi:hypothetical protein
VDLLLGGIFLLLFGVTNGDSGWRLEEKDDTPRLFALFGDSTINRRRLGVRWAICGVVSSRFGVEHSSNWRIRSLTALIVLQSHCTKVYVRGDGGEYCVSSSKSERAPFGSAEKMTVRMMKMSTTCSAHKILFNFFASWKMYDSCLKPSHLWRRRVKTYVCT